MPLRDELKPWRTPEGTLLNENFTRSGNSLLYFGHEFNIAEVLREVQFPEDKERFERVVRNHYLEGFPGILNRSPGDNSYKQAHDDYIGIVSAAQLLGSSIAGEILKALQNADWDGENQNPTIWEPASWFSIRPGVVAHVKMAASTKDEVVAPSLLEQLTWYFRVKDVAKYDFKSQGASGPLLVWHYVKTYERYKVITGNSHWLLDKALKIWHNELEKKEPIKLMGAAFGEFFKSHHPFSKAMMCRK